MKEIYEVLVVSESEDETHSFHRSLGGAKAAAFRHIEAREKTPTILNEWQEYSGAGEWYTTTTNNEYRVYISAQPLGD